MINPVLNIIAPPAQNAKQSDTKTPDGFGAVLARQMSDKAASDRSTASGNQPESKTAQAEKSTAVNDQANQDQVPAPDATTNPLAVLLLRNQVLKDAAASGDATTGKDQTPQATAPDATANPLALLANPEIKLVTAAGSDAGGHSGKSTRSANQADLISAREKFDPAASTSTRAESLITAQPDIKTGKETFNVAELAASLPSSVPSAQALAQAVSTASGLQPNTLTSSNSNTTIAAPLGSSAWPDEFSQKISWVSTQQNQVAELHLNPPDLGPMSVVLSVSDNQATALFTSPHSAVREAIENAMPKLRESLAENGIMLGNATVSDQAPRDSGAGNFMNQRSNPRTDAAIANSTTSTTQASLPAIPARRHNGMVDTFA
ncbi:MAG: flagellar hook-length control protein FliK [Gallionella sp.]|jgi:flagellar hook-length control protein FliK